MLNSKPSSAINSPMSIRLYAIICALIALCSCTGWAMLDTDIPTLAPNDDIMAKPADIMQVQDWASLAFTGQHAAGAQSHVEMQVINQDYNLLQFGKSCLETPIKLGNQTYTHGLGTHANSEILVQVPKGVNRFIAMAGVDNNSITGGTRGSVQFIVKVNEEEVVHTDTLTAASAAVPIWVDIPAGVSQIRLIVDNAGDCSCDQADWAEARFITTDNHVIYLDDNQPNSMLLSTAPPFSFVYNGISSKNFIDSWTRTSEMQDYDSKVVYNINWDDPVTNLRVSAVVTVFKLYPAVDWVVYFENRGSADTPIIENIQAADFLLRTSSDQQKAILHRIAGDSCSEGTFVPYDTDVSVSQSISMAPSGGRPSNTTAFPFFNYQYEDKGIIAAIGWSGQWKATLERLSNSPTRLQAGMELTHLVLHPGEKIRTPRVLLMDWKGDLQAAQNRFRRLMLFNYVPKQNNKPTRMPIALQTFDRYIGRSGWATEAGQLDGVANAYNMGCDTYWLDAGWLLGGLPNGVGNWFPDSSRFPNGLKPIGDACHERDLRFILWFEPERVAAGSQIATEHPEWVFGGSNGGLFKLSDDNARQWLTELLCSRIKEYGIDTYRNDFNIDPLGYWRGNDAADRQGMTEIQYVEGHYQMWDEMIARNPGLWIDNCASGGRRIDLESCMRSFPLWRSDTSCWAGHPEWDQVQSYGLCNYVPLFTASSWSPDAYTTRSSASTGVLCAWGYLEAGFPYDQAAAAIDEVKENQKYWYGDFYPITPCSSASDAFMAYQLHRSDLNEGAIFAFRHSNCTTASVTAQLKGIDPNTTYLIESIDDNRYKTLQVIPGSTLISSGYVINIPGTSSSRVIRYRPTSGTLSCVKGTVLKSNGDPAAGATVQASNGCAGTAGTDGKYEILMTSGSVRLKASLAGYISQSKDVVVSDSGTVEDVNFVLDSLPPSIANSAVFSANCTDSSSSTTYANDGNYSTYWATNWQDGWIELDWPAPVTFTRSLVRMPGGNFFGSGPVVFEKWDAGRQVWTDFATTSRANVIPADNGDWVLEIDSPVPVTTSKLRCYFDGSLKVSEWEIINLPQDDSCITGRITNAKTGTPLQHVLISVSGGRSTYTDSDGKYAIAVGTGNWSITASRSHFVTQTRLSIKVDPDKAVTDQNIALAPIDGENLQAYSNVNVTSYYVDNQSGYNLIDCTDAYWGASYPSTQDTAILDWGVPITFGYVAVPPSTAWQRNGAFHLFKWNDVSGDWSAIGDFTGCDFTHVFDRPITTSKLKVVVDSSDWPPVSVPEIKVQKWWQGVADAKTMADGTLVWADSWVVTATFANGVYVESPDRTCGILVTGLTAGQVAEGDIVTISGTMSTVAAERIIAKPTLISSVKPQ